jgi:hypothetical protein
MGWRFGVSPVDLQDKYREFGGILEGTPQKVASMEEFDGVSVS